jgi:3-deoxy-7-phosphoheptulonate synthase
MRPMSTVRLGDWTPETWQARPASQQPAYPDAAATTRVLARLNGLPPLVSHGEVDRLRAELARVARGEAFLLQGGDCAESFEDCNAERISTQLGVLMQMSLVLMQGLGQRVVRVGRLAGQYAKPRSADLEVRDGVALPSYRGDLINSAPFTAADRTPDPELLLRGYERAALTLNYARALLDGGLADLAHPARWDHALFKAGPMSARYEALRVQLLESLRLMEQLAGQPLPERLRFDVFTSHEGLHLLYEQAQTRWVAERGRFYDLSTHFPWIGLRTATPGSAHLEFFRGIANPIAVKVGPGMDPAWVLELAALLDPQHEPGRLTLIHRFGAARIARELPPLLAAMRAAGRAPVWVCDPMHGNTEVTASGVKTRRFERIAGELEEAFRIHAAAGVPLGGVHVELTGEDVTECIGGTRGPTEADLERAYRSQVDPRLNHAQALELALRMAEAHATRHPTLRLHRP